MSEYEWGGAEVSYPDWSGTAQLDQKMTGDVDEYSLTGVDRDKWVIIGLDFGGGESGMHALEVIAVRKSDWREAKGTSQVKAASIRIHNGVDPFDLLRQIMHVFDMRLRIRSVTDSTIVITESLDEPPQP
ncbi:MAG: hypothetical protein ACRDUX_26315 [Mycobacterium sp.]